MTADSSQRVGGWARFDMFAEKEQQGGVGCDDGHGDSAVHAFRALDLLEHSGVIFHHKWLM